MDSTTLYFKNFTSIRAYQREVKQQTVLLLRKRLKLFGLTVDDIENKETVNKYGIARDDKEESDGSIMQTIRIMGISVVETYWEQAHATISAPEGLVDYTLTKQLIAQMPTKI